MEIADSNVGMLHQKIADQQAEIIRLSNELNELKSAQDSIKIREEKYKSIIENMPPGVLEVDDNDRIMFANQSFCRITGYSPNELMGKIASDLFPCIGHETLVNEKNSPCKKDFFDIGDVCIKDKYGNDKWIMVSRMPLYNGEKKLIGLVGVYWDITAHKMLEADLLQSKKLSEESSKAKEIFLANMSHEIRTPINAILGMSRLLTKTPQNNQQKVYINAIIKSAENLIVIINDILDLSKIEAGQMQIESIGFNLSDLVNQLERVLKYKTEEKGLELNTACSVHIPPVLIGDAYRINQILLNLMGNAIKFTDKGSVELWCKLVDVKNGVNQIMFIVKDTGIGIEPQYLKHLYQDFSQEDAGITRKFGGTGLGLSISKRLITLMGGNMNIESTKGTGTVISFVLSLPSGDESHMPQIVGNELDDAEYYHVLSGKKILLVEDNEFNRLLAETILTSYGVLITGVVNGKAAIDMMANEGFDLIIMDVQMPVMNGFEATSYIRQVLKSTVPILALTANAVKGEKAKCLEAGMDDYIAKPFDETHLIQTICNLIHQTNKTTEPRVKQPKLIKATDELYNLTVLQETAGADAAFVQHMLKTFIKQCTESLELINKALIAKDVPRLKAIAHKLKPSINYLKMKDISEVIKEIQGWESKFDSRFEERVEVLKNKLERAVNIIQSDMSRMYPS